MMATIRVYMICMLYIVKIYKYKPKKISTWGRAPSGPVLDPPLVNVFQFANLLSSPLETGVELHLKKN